jgi:PIN domain nuclease of toxin-antitoxin system
MYCLADTVALVWHLRGHRRLGRQARRTLREVDQGHHTIAISGMTLGNSLSLGTATHLYQFGQAG